MYLLSNGVKIISFITDPQLIRHILEHLAAGSESLWLGEASGYRDLPETRPAKKPLIKMAIVYEHFKPALNLIQ